MLKKLDRETALAPQLRPVKVLQFGEGNFLRAFADWIIDTLNRETDFNGAVQVVQPIKNGMGDLVNTQQGLYHVVLNGLKNGKPFNETRLITSLQNVINPYADYQQFLKTAENEDLQFIISNTTEAGIAFNENDRSPSQLPDSFPGKLTALLYHRFTFFNGAPEKGLFIMPCELIEKNGDNLKRAIQQFIAHWNLPESFSRWIEKNNIFCNTLVDRIVPGYPKDTVQDVNRQTGYEDRLVVMAEPFHLWVIEAPEKVRKRFPVEKTDLQVKFVPDLTPYRTRKVRILNGAHTALVPVAYLQGLRTVQESVEDATSGEFIKKAIFEEIIPTLDLPAAELQQFANDVIERFRNPFIRHELSSIALNSISKYKVRVLPSVLEYQKRTGKLPERLVHSLAKLILFYKGEWQGETLPVNDTPEILGFFKKSWESNDPEKVVKDVLSNVSFWDTDLTKVEGLQKKVLDEVNKAFVTA